MAQSFHPSHSQPSQAISPDAALKHLQSYLEATATTAYLHPNAKLTVGGPSAEMSTSSLTLHNLRRVEAGLRGEWLAPSLELSTGADKSAGGKKTKFGDETTVLEAPGAEDAMDVDEAAAAGWQDGEEFRREQSIVEDEVGPRETGVGQTGNIIVPVHVGVVDKEARKREKKERMKAEKKAAIAAKQAAK